jgi:C_GCAxxG_C_C family probable redox protein
MSEQKTAQSIARTYFLDCDNNCAEASFRGVMESHGCPVTPEAAHAIGIFGGGLGCGETCGALAGCAAALGSFLIEERAHTSPDARDVANIFTNKLKEECGSIRCEDLKPIYSTPEHRCVSMVEKAIEIFEGVYEAYQKGELVLPEKK